MKAPARAAALTLLALAASTVLLPASTGAVEAGAQGRKPTWAARYFGPLGDGGIDEANAIGVSPDGGTIFVTGRSDGASASYNDYATIAYDAATGAQLWVARYNGPASRMDIARALAVSPDGSTVFVTGSSEGGDETDDFATIAYDATTGAGLWISRYNGPGAGEDAAYSLDVTPDGSTVVVTGTAVGISTEEDFTTIAHDASTGAVRWFAAFNGPSDLGDGANAVVVSPDGSTAFVTGSSTGVGTESDFTTIAYEVATGARRWVARYDGPVSGGDGATALGVSPDGSAVFVTGVSDETAEDYATVAYDAEAGEELWVARYDGPGNGYDRAVSLGVSPDGSTVFITGESDALESRDYATISYEADTGAQRWLARMDHAGALDRAADLAVSPDGSTVFVTGEGHSGELATAAYHAQTGATRWRSSSGGPGSDGANALAVAPDGSQVFVTGQLLRHLQFGTDYLTVAIPA